MEIACIVEGEGEAAALPRLILRIIDELHQDHGIRVVISTNFKGRDKFQDERLVKRAVDNAARRVGPDGAVLILRDADNDCPVTEAQRLRRWATEVRSDARVSVVIAKREYEAWFLAAGESLRGYLGVRSSLGSHADPESVNDAKNWLTRNMVRGQPYKPTVHQKPFSQRMNLVLARQRSDSFDKLCRDIQRLVEAIRAPED